MLEAAYDDAQGVTAEFNRNVLRVLNRELDADFDPEDFDHVALFDPEHEWIEMRLRARREHTTLVRALDLPVHFDAGEEVRTEISAKFTPERLEGDLSAAGLELVRWLTDPDELFALTLSKRSSGIGSATMQIEGSSAIVVGGASGLGEATVRALHARGAIVTHRRRQRREGRGAGRGAGRATSSPATCARRTRCRRPSSRPPRPTAGCESRSAARAPVGRRRSRARRGPTR